MGVSALVSHKTKIESHKLKEASLESNSSLYFTENIQMSPPATSQFTSSTATNKSKSSAPAKQSISSAQAKQSAFIPSYTDKAIVENAEIRWAIKVVISHFSYRSCLDINKLFQNVFPDSSVANDFSKFFKTKCARTVHFGIAPYRKNELLQAANDSPFHSILFDGSLNSNLQQCQMDVRVRFWDSTSGKAISRYLTSQFLKSPNAANLLKHLTEALDPVHQKRMTTLSMDGPSVNLCVFRQLNESRLNEEKPALFETGI